MDDDNDVELDKLQCGDVKERLDKPRSNLELDKLHDELDKLVGQRQQWEQILVTRREARAEP